MTSILLLGFGAIGRDLVRHLEPELSAGRISLVGAVVRDRAAHEARGSLGVRLLEHTDVEALLPQVDLVVECAGVDAVAEHARWLASKPLVLTSVGALTYPEVAATLLNSPALTVTNGAIGGFDALEAAAASGGLERVTIETRKLAASLVRPWMSDTPVEKLRTLGAEDAPLTVFEGSPREAIDKFPANVNVAVALAWATKDAVGRDPLDAFEQSLARVEVRLVADPAAERSSHRIHASGPSGVIELAFESAPSPSNPKTSAMTARSVARDVRRAFARMR